MSGGSFHLFEFHVLLDVLSVFLVEFAQLPFELVTFFDLLPHAVDRRLGCRQSPRTFPQYIDFVLAKVKISNQILSTTTSQSRLKDEHQIQFNGNNISGLNIECFAYNNSSDSTVHSYVNRVICH